MKMVALNNVCSVDAERVESIFVQPRSFETGNEAVVVSMQNGDKFRIEAGYNKSIYAVHDKTVKLIEEARHDG